VAEVLVVDDDPDIRIMLRFALEDVGFDVRLAADGVEALAALRERAPDCMVLDLMMPNLDGFGLLCAMHETGLGAATRTVMLTCKVDEADVVKGLELGAHEYLGKPFDPERLGGILQRLLDSTPEALAGRRRAQLDEAALHNHIVATLARPRRRAGSLPLA
jgi:DNA-binding response OmpR family regulator